MALELHIWGPAFTLPSIDPDCLAAVAYLTQVMPRGGWVLIASSDEGRSDIRQLPALHDGSKIVCGFQGIVLYLRNISNGQWDLDATLTPLQRADCTAWVHRIPPCFSFVLKPSPLNIAINALTVLFRFSTFLSTHALPLLDLSLYVSSQNYATTTRPAYAPLLGFPSSWVIPTRHRAAAKQRSVHLGLSALDLSNSSQTENDNDSSATSSISVPESLRKAKASVSAAIKAPETASRIRLHVLTENTLDPLATLLSHVSPTNTAGSKEAYLLNLQRPSSLDCLALGYLALFLVPSVPNPFLATILKEKYPGLTHYVRRGIQQCYGGAVKLEDARPGLGPSTINDEDEEVDLSTYNNMDIGSGDVELPWREAPSSSPLGSVGIVLREAVGGIPGLGTLVKSDPIQYSTATKDSAIDTTVPNVPTSLFSTLLAVGAGVAAIGGAVLYAGGLGLGEVEDSMYDGGRARKTRLADMGEAGEVLAMGSFGEPNSREKRTAGRL
ncbi:hypothetical protein MMC18_007086 [Xylographa bjoerkii]|nr:hypothetical protein [Xylographa bjoerkii]